MWAYRKRYGKTILQNMKFATHNMISVLLFNTDWNGVAPIFVFVKGLKIEKPVNIYTVAGPRNKENAC